MEQFARYTDGSQPDKGAGCTVFIGNVSAGEKQSCIRMMPSCCLIYCLEGGMNIAINGNEHYLCKNALLIYRPNDLMELKPCRDCVFICAVYTMKYLSQQFDFPKDVYPHFVKIKNGGFSILKNSHAMQFEALANCLLSIKRLGTGSHWMKYSIQSAMKALLCMSLCWIDDSVETTYQAAEDMRHNTYRNREIFSRFMELVSKHFMTERRVEFYASKLCITPSICHM